MEDHGHFSRIRTGFRAPETHPNTSHQRWDSAVLHLKICCSVILIRIFSIHLSTQGQSRILDHLCIGMDKVIGRNGKDICPPDKVAVVGFTSTYRCTYRNLSRKEGHVSTYATAGIPLSFIHGRGDVH